MKSSKTPKQTMVSGLIWSGSGVVVATRIFFTQQSLPTYLWLTIGIAMVVFGSIQVVRGFLRAKKSQQQETPNS